MAAAKPEMMPEPRAMDHLVVGETFSFSSGV